MCGHIVAFTVALENLRERERERERERSEERRHKNDNRFLRKKIKWEFLVWRPPFQLPRRYSYYVCCLLR